MSAARDVHHMGRTVDALAIIFTAPLWPRRDDLPESAKPLHDIIVETAKPLAMAVACERFDDALRVASTWSEHVEAVMDDKGSCQNPSVPLLLAVYRHYVKSAGCDFAKIEKNPRGTRVTA